MLPAKAKYFTTYKNSYGIFGEKKMVALRDKC
jgi:hypothetical protein